MSLTVRAMTARDSDWMQAGSAPWRKPDGYFARCHEQQRAGELAVLVACDGSTYVGHVKLVWIPTYEDLRERGIPEIQDLFVVPAYRRRKAASRLLDRAEAMAGERSATVGISVGLHPGYNAAQRLYGRRGYVPDGLGVTFRDEYVREGQTVCMDDSFLLHFTKDIRDSA